MYDQNGVCLGVFGRVNLASNMPGYRACVSQRGEEWAARLNSAIGRQVRKYRQAKDWSVQRVSDEIEARHGVTIKRPVLSNLEHGRRPTISPDELFAIADVLDVPALLLLFPVGGADKVEPLPGVEMTPWQALQWAEEGGDDVEEPDGVVVQLFREHDRAVRAWRGADRKVETTEQLIGRINPDTGTVVDGEDEVTADYLQRRRDTLEAERAHCVDEISRFRKAIRGAGLTPPRLQLGLRYIDDSETEQP